MKRTDFIRRFVSGIIALPVLGLKNPLEAAPEAKPEPLKPDCAWCDGHSSECDLCAYGPGEAEESHGCPFDGIGCGEYGLSCQGYCMPPSN